MIKLTDGKLYVKGEMTDVFELQMDDIRTDMIINVTLVPNEYTSENGVSEVNLSFDPLNETLTQVLKDEGFIIVSPEQINSIQVA